MKKGDIVIIKDSSYSNVITKNGLKSSYDGLHSVKNKQGRVIELGCRFPYPNQWQIQYGRYNNTVVMTNSGRVVFIEECLLELVNKPIREVTMAEVCGQFGEDVKIKKD